MGVVCLGPLASFFKAFPTIFSAPNDFDETFHENVSTIHSCVVFVLYPLAFCCWLYDMMMMQCDVCGIAGNDGGKCC